MTDKAKKILIVGVVVIFVIAIGIGAYLGWKRSSQTDIALPSIDGKGEFPILPGQSRGPGTGSVPGLNIPETSDLGAGEYDDQKGRLWALTMEKTADFWIDTTDPAGTSSSLLLHSRVRYLNEKGEVKEVEAIGKETVLAASSFGVPLWAEQNRDGSRVIVKFTPNTFVIFDSKTKTWEKLESGVSSVSFSPDGKRLAYLKEGENGSLLYLKQLDASRNALTLLASLALADMRLRWGAADRLFLLPRLSYDFSGTGWFFDLNRRTLNRFLEGRALDVIFSYTTEDFLLFSSRSRSEVSMSLFSGIDKSGLDIPFSFFSLKCAFSFDSPEAFCALPAEHNKEFSLTIPDDYLRKEALFLDRIFVIDAKTKNISPILDAPMDIDARRLKIAREQLFFINALDGRLYVYNLK